MALFEILIILLLILTNGAFAAAEMAVVAARRVRLELMSNAGDRRAGHALQLLDHPNTFLSTVQIGITLVGTLASAFGGARVARGLALALDRVPWLQPYSAALSLGIVVVCITYLSLVLGELAPKRLALQNPEQYTRLIARPFLLLSSLSRPLVNFLTWSSATVASLVSAGPVKEPSVTEEEIEAMLETGAEEGVLAQEEQRLMQSVLDLSDTQVRTIMRPRTTIVAVEAGRPLNEVLSLIVQSGFSKLPVYEKDLDHVIGILHVRDLIGLEAGRRQEDVARYARLPLFVVEGMSVFHLLETFKRQRAHIAIVLDEYGGTAGLVTLTDVLEEIVGEVGEEDQDQESFSIRRLDANTWLVDGLMPVEDVREVLWLPPLPGEDRYLFETLSGFIMTQLGRIPRKGDVVTIKGVQLEVLKMARRRVELVRITRLPGRRAANSR